MQCPLDGTTLETHTVQSVHVEECPQCLGLWFEEGQLREAKDETEADLVWLDFDLWSDQESFTTDWSSRKCPQCSKNMATISYGETGVVVEYCINGHGVWLDKGEFQAIITALEAEVSSKSASGYVASSLRAAADLIIGDEDFVSEWDDLLTVLRMLQYRVLSENPKVAELLVALQAANPFK